MANLAPHQLECEHCAYLFTSEELLNQHCSDEHAAKARKCNFCGQYLGNKVVLHNHLVKVHKFLQCDICFISCSGYHSIISHKARHHPLKCKLCGDSFSSLRLLDQHYVSHGLCRVCDKVLGTKALMDSHLITVHNYVQCNICPEPKLFSSKKTLGHHEYNEHRIRCDKCGEVFKSRVLMKQHCSEKHVQCRSCGETFDNQAALDVHIEEVHKFFKCEICSKFLVSEVSVKNHIYKQHRNRCNQCGIILHSIKMLKKHCLEVHGSKGCPYCKESFITQDLLDTHLVTAHKYIPCKECCKSYPKKTSLEVHVSRLHPSICKLCGGSFTSEKMLKRHISEKHARRDISCQVCSEVLSSETTLNSHLVSVHKFLQCQSCVRVFPNSQLLYQHKYKRHRLKCKYCNQYLQTKSLFVKHMNEQHKCSGDHDDPAGESEEDDLSADSSFEIGKYECFECDANFETFHELEYHKKSHIPRIDHSNENIIQPKIETCCEIYYPCNMCNAVFELPEDLEKHSKNHIEKKQLIPTLDNSDDSTTTNQPAFGSEIEQLHQCSICYAVFDISDDLERHSKDHIKKETDSD